jgi:hypothetical protein
VKGSARAGNKSVSLVTSTLWCPVQLMPWGDGSDNDFATERTGEGSLDTPFGGSINAEVSVARVGRTRRS